jgi:lipoprotein NlpI
VKPAANIVVAKTPVKPVQPATPPAPTPAPKVAAVTPPPPPPKPDVSPQVNASVDDGKDKFQKGDLDGAIAAYNHALDLDPKAAAALYNRGLVKEAQENADGALADYSAAIEADPKMAMAYYSRGLARHSHGDLDGATGDYNQTVQIDPKNALAYFNRGLIRMQRDDIDGAIVDSSRALELDPHLIQAYYNRGLGRLAQGAMDAALSDMKTFCQQAPQDAYTDYARLYIWLIRTRQGQLAEASHELNQAMNSGWNGAADAMVTKIGEYLLGQIREEDLIKAAVSPVPIKDQGQHCEVWYFIGMRHLESGDKETAAQDLRKCVQTQKTDYCEYILAQEELKSLGAAGTAGVDTVAAPAPVADPVKK